MPKLRNGNNGDSNPGSLDCESGILPTELLRIDHVIIPKAHCSSREGVNSHCRRFDWLIFAVLGQSVRLSITAAVVSVQRRVAGHSTMTAADRIVSGAAGPFNNEMHEGRFGDGLINVFRVYKKC